jgi:sugar phosphate isomerase/epimerase
MTTIHRRDALKLFAVGAGAVAALPSALSAATTPKDRISLQLYSVRQHFKKMKLPEVLKQVSKMGYQGVEFWGGSGYNTYEKNPAELKKILDDLNLAAAGTHIGTGAITGNAIKKTMDFHGAIGCKYICIPGDRRFCHKERSKALAEIFNKAAEVLKPAGLYTGYHNHSQEMKKAEGDKTWWDLFAERTSKDVVLQQDVGWTVHAGVDPVPLIKRYPGRSKILHYKPTVVRGDKGKRRPILGEDSVKWKDVIQASREFGGVEWMTIEQERYVRGKTPFECSELSLKGLTAILASL